MKLPASEKNLPKDVPHRTGYFRATRRDAIDAVLPGIAAGQEPAGPTRPPWRTRPLDQNRAMRQAAAELVDLIGRNVFSDESQFFQRLRRFEGARLCASDSRWKLDKRLSDPPSVSRMYAMESSSRSGSKAMDSIPATVTSVLYRISERRPRVPSNALKNHQRTSITRFATCTASLPPTLLSPSETQPFRRP